MKDKENNICKKCKQHSALDLHSCPYQSDVNNDSESLCDCCEECTDECCMDI